MWKANGRTTDAYPWQKLTWPMARWAKNNQSVFLFQLLQFDYEIWEIIIYFTTCFIFDICSIHYLHFVNYLEVGHIIFCWRLQKLLQLLWYGTVTFQKGWGRGLLQFVWYCEFIFIHGIPIFVGASKPRI